MSASNIKVDTHIVTQAGVDMGDAANTTHEVLGNVAAATQPATVSDIFGEPHLNAVFNDFWNAFHSQVQLSGDVFAQLGKLMGRGAVKLDNGDIVNANALNKVSGNTPAVAPTTTGPAPAAAPVTPSLAPPGTDNNPPPPPPSAPPPTSAPPPSSSPPGTISSPGSATGV
jgi:hypothetical protein